MTLSLCACASKNIPADKAGPADTAGPATTGAPAAPEFSVELTNISQLFGWWEIATLAATGNPNDFDTLMAVGFCEDDLMIYKGSDNTYYGYYYGYLDNGTRLESRLFHSYEEFMGGSGIVEAPEYRITRLDGDTMELYNTIHGYSNTYTRVYESVPDEYRYPQPPEPAFEPDYAPGKAETVSKFNPHGVNMGNGNRQVYPTMVCQDETLYFISYSNFLCKIHRNNTAPEDVIYLYDMSGFKDFDDLQIVGDWIYFDYRCNGSYIPNTGDRDDKFGIARVRTDGLEMEVLVTDAFGGSSGNYPEYVVRDNKLWYVTRFYERASASELRFTSFLMRMDLETKEVETMYIAQDCGDSGMAITAYTDETMMLSISNYPKEEITWAYNFAEESMVESLRYMGNTNYTYYAAGDTYFRYDSAFSESTLYSYSPENSFAEEEAFVEKRGHWTDIYPCDDLIFISRLNKFRVIENGQFREINSDFATVRGWDGEYVYYYCNEMFCRVRPDGSGWEELLWWKTHIGPLS